MQIVQTALHPPQPSSPSFLTWPELNPLSKWKQVTRLPSPSLILTNSPGFICMHQSEPKGAWNPQPTIARCSVQALPLHTAHWTIRPYHHHLSHHMISPPPPQLPRVEADETTPNHTLLQGTNPLCFARISGSIFWFPELWIFGIRLFFRSRLTL